MGRAPPKGPGPCSLAINVYPCFARRRPLEFGLQDVNQV